MRFVNVSRRHLPPPHTNFDKLQDILQKRKGLKLDVSSSGALADSLDKCIVRSFLVSFDIIDYSTGAGSERTGFQHVGAHHGNEMHAFCRIFQLWQRVARHVWALRSCKPDLYTFHKSYPSLRGCVFYMLPALLKFDTYLLLRCSCSSPARCRHRLYPSASLSPLKNAHRTYHGSY